MSNDRPQNGRKKIGGTTIANSAPVVQRQSSRLHRAELPKELNDAHTAVACISAATATTRRIAVMFTA